MNAYDLKCPTCAADPNETCTAEGVTIFLPHYARRLAAADRRARVEALQSGKITPNQVREAEGLRPIGESWADARYTPAPPEIEQPQFSIGPHLTPWILAIPTAAAFGVICALVTLSGRPPCS